MLWSFGLDLILLKKNANILHGHLQNSPIYESEVLHSEKEHKQMRQINNNHAVQLTMFQIRPKRKTIAAH